MVKHEVSPCSNYLFPFKKIGFINRKSNCWECKEMSAPSNKPPSLKVQKFNKRPGAYSRHYGNILMLITMF